MAGGAPLTNWALGQHALPLHPVGRHSHLPCIIELLADAGVGGVLGWRPALSKGPGTAAGGLGTSRLATPGLCSQSDPHRELKHPPGSLMAPHPHVQHAIMPLVMTAPTCEPGRPDGVLSAEYKCHYRNEHQVGQHNPPLSQASSARRPRRGACSHPRHHQCFADKHRMSGWDWTPHLPIWASWAVRLAGR